VTADFRYEGRDLEAMSLAPNYHAWILRDFAPYLGKKVAEVGAGSGTFSELLLACPIEELVAVEPSPEMYPLLHQRFRDTQHVECVQTPFSTLGAERPGYFDSVLYVNVLEHIEDDETELQHVRDSLKEGGTVCIFVPALKWLYGEHDRSVGHQRRYYKKQLKHLLEKTVFEIVTIRYFDIAGVLPWWFLMRIMKRRLSDGNAAFYDAYIVPVMSKIESVVHPTIGKNLIAVARKKS
jgi:SAM-dependent methyltransferase